MEGRLTTSLGIFCSTLDCNITVGFCIVFQQPKPIKNLALHREMDNDKIDFYVWISGYKNKRRLFRKELRKSAACFWFGKCNQSNHFFPVLTRTSNMDNNGRMSECRLLLTQFKQTYSIHWTKLCVCWLKYQIIVPEKAQLRDGIYKEMKQKKNRKN